MANTSDGKLLNRQGRTMAQRLRWHAIVTYRAEGGSLEVDHAFDEISDLEVLIERGPSFESIIDIRIKYYGTDRKMTIEEGEFDTLHPDLADGEDGSGALTDDRLSRLSRGWKTGGQMKIDPEIYYPPSAPELRPVGAIQTLARWRHEGRGPEFVKSGARVLYRGSDVIAWLEARRIKTEAAA